MFQEIKPGQENIVSVIIQLIKQDGLTTFPGLPVFQSFCWR